MDMRIIKGKKNALILFLTQKMLDLGHIKPQELISYVVVPGPSLPKKVSLFQDSRQEEGVSISIQQFIENYRALRKAGKIDKALSRGSKLIQGWFSKPTTYPDILRDRGVVLPGNTRGQGIRKEVLFVYWSDNRLHESWTPVRDLVSPDSVALIKE